MNPSGYRIDEEKKLDAPTTPNSYKSTRSSRSSVLERAREYSRRVEQKDVDRQRSRSLDPRSQTPNLQQQQQQSYTANNNNYHNHSATTSAASNSAASSSYTHPEHSTSGRRSQSAGRAARPQHPPHGNQAATRERAMASVRHDSAAPSGAYANNNNYQNNNNNSTSKTNPSQRMSQPDPQQQPPPPAAQENAVVTPELLVDALSGHEDGLLAIAEKLMEHYDQGYDVMGEAIIDAFADVQKLFQHVVEAAHMEGAAFEASRRDEELQELKNQVEQLQGGLLVDSQNHHGNPYLYQSNSPMPSPSNNNKDGSNNKNNNNNSTPSGPHRHDEFIDQDVQDALTDAIRQGTALAQTNPQQCYQIYEIACQDASSLLPVDSDHRGRLQLSLARAESMSAERACAILRYAMDDVLRSARRALHAQTPLPDVSQRADVVLQRNTAAHHSHLSVVQSSDEALASLMEEMKEILSAPIYNDTPLQNVAQRFWTALQEAQKVQHKNAERLEQNLGKLKGEFLLARAEWEEKLNQSTEMAESFKQKYRNLQDSLKSRSQNASTSSVADSSYLGQAKSFNEHHSVYDSVKSVASGKAETVASGVSGLAAQARTIVMNTSFNCAGNHSNSTSHDDDSVLHSSPPSRLGRTGQQQRPSSERSRSRSKNSRSFREYSRSPQRVDV